MSEIERIAIVGVGKMGLCFALNLEHAGFIVLGLDKKGEYCSSLNNKTLESSEEGVTQHLKTSKNFTSSTRPGDLLDFNPHLIFLCVNTSRDSMGGYNHDNVDAALHEIFNLGTGLDHRDIVIMSTTLPGYCDEKAEEAQKHQFTISYNPEFIAQGSIMRDQLNPDQVLIGEANERVGDKITSVYEILCKSAPVFCRMSRLSAEITKLATNCFLTMKIAFANSIGDLAIKTGAEHTKILEAIGTDSRIGNKYLKYGFGFGGPCFPRDNLALSYFADQHSYELLLSKSTDLANSQHLEFQVRNYLESFPEDQSIHFYSVTYKPGTSIIEESQQLALALSLAKANRKVVVHDKADVIEQVRSLYGDLFDYIVVNK